MTVTVTHSTAADGTFSAQGALAWDANHTLTGVGTMAEQDANNIAVTGGVIDGAAIGGTTPSTGVFTTLDATSFATNVAAAGLTLSGTSLTADGTDTNINMSLTPKGNGGLGINGTPTGDIAGSTLTAKFCVKQNESGPVAGFVKANNSSAAPGATIYGCRSRGTLLSPTVVQNNDTLISLLALGFDGTDLAQSAEIDFQVDGTPGANDMPGRIVFKTSPDGSQTTGEAMRIDSTQTVSMSKADINGGAIDGTIIGAASAAAITGTTITATNYVGIGGGVF